MVARAPSGTDRVTSKGSVKVRTRGGSGGSAATGLERLRTWQRTPPDSLPPAGSRGGFAGSSIRVAHSVDASELGHSRVVNFTRFAGSRGPVRRVARRHCVFFGTSVVFKSFTLIPT